MKKILYTLVFLTASFSSFAQFSVTADTVVKEGVTKGISEHVKCYVTNTSTTDSITIKWNKTGETLLSGWSGVSLCDNIQCYSYDNSSHSFKLAPGAQGFLEVSLTSTSSAADGCNLTNVRFSQVGGTATKDVLFKICAWPSSVKDYENNEIVTIYPNPASDHVNITFNDKKISSVNVMNVIGRKVAKFDVDANKSNQYRVPLSNVADGIYILQFADANGKILGVRRVTKQ